MKYLKKFESINYYYSIDHDEWQKLMGIQGVRLGVNREKFTSKERDILSNILDSKNVKYIFDKPTFASYHGVEIELDKYKWIIDKVKDEWFLVVMYSKGKIYSERYKCDQFDGLIKLINDKIK